MLHPDLSSSAAATAGKSSRRARGERIQSMRFFMVLGSFWMSGCVGFKSVTTVSTGRLAQRTRCSATAPTSALGHGLLVRPMTIRRHRPRPRRCRASPRVGPLRRTPAIDATAVPSDDLGKRLAAVREAPVARSSTPGRRRGPARFGPAQRRRAQWPARGPLGLLAEVGADHDVSKRLHGSPCRRTRPRLQARRWISARGVQSALDRHAPR